MIKRGDTVYIRTGSQKGKTGRVLAVNPKKGTILVEGINKAHRHQRPSQKNPKGGIVTREQPVHISNVALFIQTGEGPKPTRVKTKVIDDSGKKVKVRISRLTGEQI
jgi:large subunit ribosomal protein L24